MKIKLDIETIDNRLISLALKDSKSDSFIDVQIPDPQNINSPTIEPEEGPPDQ